jgi:CMP-N-acetylneuraminic acid synthetase
VLSTDDEEIAAEGLVAGIDVPSLRPEELATDLASGYSVWRHAHLDAEARAARAFDISILIQPTSPFRTVADVEACVDLVIGGEFDSAVTVSPNPAHFAPEKTMTLTRSGGVKPYLPSNQFQPTRQLIPSYYHLNGVCYAARRDVLLDHKHIFLSDRTGAVVIDRHLVNIDDPFDLKLARWLWEQSEQMPRADRSRHEALDRED